MRPELVAHVKWFTDPLPHPTEWALLLTLPVLAAFAAALAAAGIAAIIQRRVAEPEALTWLERYAKTGPFVLGLHVGTALLVAAIVGVLFTPNLHPNDDLLGRVILIIEAMCGLMLLLGLATRAATVLLVVLGIMAMQPFTFESILENIHVLGIAAFFFIVGRGPISLDRVRGVRPPIRSAEAPAAALVLLRLALGFGIAFSALTEKLLDPGLAQALLDQRPYLNAGRAFGLGDPQFAFLVGVTELTIGVVIMSGQLTRPVMALGALIFTSSLPLFGWSELLGHLPFYGIMFMLFIAPDADSWQVRRQLRPSA